MPSSNNLRSIAQLFRSEKIDNSDWAAILEDVVACIRPHLKELSVGCLGDVLMPIGLDDYRPVSLRLSELSPDWGKTEVANTRGLFFPVYPDEKWMSKKDHPPIIGINLKGEILLADLEISSGREITGCQITRVDSFSSLIPEIIASPSSALTDLKDIVTRHVRRRQKLLEEARDLKLQIDQISHVVDLMQSK